MNPHELAYVVVEYYDRETESQRKVGTYLRFLPRKGEILTVHTSKGETIRRRVCSIEHIAEDQRRIEQDIIIRTEAL